MDGRRTAAVASGLMDAVVVVGVEGGMMTQEQRDAVTDLRVGADGGTVSWVRAMVWRWLSGEDFGWRVWCEGPIGRDAVLCVRHGLEARIGAGGVVVMGGVERRFRRRLAGVG
jgi:hypothetical protein